MVNKKISIDLDGIICNFVAAVIKLSKISPGIKNLPNDYQPPDWDFSDKFTPEEFGKVFEAIRNTKNFWKNIPVYPDNMNTLLNFWNKHSDYDFYYITARDETEGASVLEQTTKFLLGRQVWPMKLRASVIPVKSSKFKADVMRALGIGCSIDDYAPTVEACNRDVAGHQAFLLDRPWNQNVSLPRVKSLEEFFYKVTGEEKPKKTKKKKHKTGMGSILQGLAPIYYDTAVAEKLKEDYLTVEKLKATIGSFQDYNIKFTLTPPPPPLDWSGSLPGSIPANSGKEIKFFQYDLEGQEEKTKKPYSSYILPEDTVANMFEPEGWPWNKEEKK